MTAFYINLAIGGLVQGLIIALAALAINLVFAVGRFANAATGDYLTFGAYAGIAAQALGFTSTLEMIVKLHLLGAMYTMPKGAKLSRLDDRVPISIGRWHKHVNWCVPHKGDEARWFEQRNGKPVFGPESPIATKGDCDAVRGEFHPNLFGWMIHVNVYEGTELGTIFGDDHGPHPR